MHDCALNVLTVEYGDGTPNEFRFSTTAGMRPWSHGSHTRCLRQRIERAFDSRRPGRRDNHTCRCGACRCGACHRGADTDATKRVACG